MLGARGDVEVRATAFGDDRLLGCQEPLGHQLFAAAVDDRGHRPGVFEADLADAAVGHGDRGAQGGPGAFADPLDKT